MRVHKFIVDNMPEAILRIRKELGKDAVILETKKIYEKKRWGFKKIPKLEVIASIGQETPEVQSRLSVTQKEDKGIQAELSEMRSMLSMALNTTHGTINTLTEYLREQGFTKAQATELIEESYLEKNQTDTSMKDVLRGCIMHKLSSVGDAQPIASESRIVSFVGPTGVGKTTTIAKLAAMQSLNGKKKVGLITTDTFRIAAIDQLKTYAKILDVPLEVAYTPNDLEQAVQNMKDRDLILVDTAGRNYKLESYVEETKAFLDGISVDETFLVLSLTMKTQDLNQITEMFVDLPVDKFIFTKFDETSSYGSILDILLTHKKPMSYITIGQNVPDDIEVPSLDRIVTSVLEGVE